MKSEMINILMKRDGNTRQEAIERINECRDLILSSDIFEADDIMADMLGLEPDYIMDLFM